MDFIKHYGFEDKHAFLGPSRHHWVNYDDEKFDYEKINLKAQEISLSTIASCAMQMASTIPRHPVSLASLDVHYFVFCFEIYRPNSSIIAARARVFLANHSSCSLADSV